MKNLLFVIFILSNFCTYGQNRPKTYLDRLILGSSLTVIPDDYALSSLGGSYTRLEYTWNTNLAIDISPKWRFGFQYLSISAKNYYKARENFFLAGSFLQYNFIPKNIDRRRIYFETSYNLGNYCTCGELEPYKKDNLKHLGFGMGGDFKINNWLHIDIAFVNYIIFNKIPEKYNYTQYILGLDFVLPVKK
jgi:hypothetical protein